MATQKTSMLETLAKNTAVNYSTVSGNAQAALDPATITSFITMIMDLIKQIQACRKTPAAATAAANAPNLFQKIILRRHVRGEMGQKDFRDHGDHVIHALLKTGANVTQAEIEALYKEV